MKPRKRKAGEGGNLRGRGNSAGAGVRYTERPLLRVRTVWGVWECVSESGIPPNLDEGPITPLRKAQQAYNYSARHAAPGRIATTFKHSGRPCHTLDEAAWPLLPSQSYTGRSLVNRRLSRRS